ncbi:hypothetical protein ACXOLT_08185 [Streptococcus thermophilus]
MAKKENKNTITVEQSHKLGFKLTDVKTGLQALRNHANTLMLAKHAGADNTGYCALKQITF